MSREREPDRPATGMLLGKFMPPHRGHLYLVEFARRYVERLTVVVGSLPSEPIPGTLRYDWMKEMFPGCNVVHLDEELPQEPGEHPDFWRIWKDALTAVLPRPPDCVFASEPYGQKLAEVLGGSFVPVDLGREIMPVSGTAVRDDPLGNWEFIPRCVRPYYVKRVCVFGPESTGKTTLARRLAEHFETAMVPEYAREHLEAQAGEIEADDIPKIARGQAAAEEALAREANRVLICDTDLLTTTIWSEVLFGDCPPWLREQAGRRSYDLTLLTDVDVAWVEDQVRYLPEERESFLARCEAALREAGRSYVKISGPHDARFETARRAVEELLRSCGGFAPPGRP